VFLTDLTHLKIASLRTKWSNLERCGLPYSTTKQKISYPFALNSELVEESKGLGFDVLRQAQYER